MSFHSAAAVALVLLPLESRVVAQPTPITVGHGLDAVCKDADKAVWTGGVCMGFIVGTVSTMKALPGSFSECIPTPSTYGQWVDVVRKHLRDHPEGRHLASAEIVVKAMRAAFCPNSKW
jgi:hypothetical protein